MTTCILISLLLVSSLYAGELQDAARRGDAEKIRQLLASGTDVNSSGEHGRTALHEAALSGKLDIVQLLIAKGADRKLLDDDHRSAASLASSLTNPVLQVQILTALGQGTQGTMVPKETDLWTLHGAASRGQVSVIDMLAKLGADVNAVGSNGNRPLSIACLKGDVRAVEILLARGADVDARNSAGAAPLHEAALSGNVAIGELLISHGAKIDAVDEASGATALYYAVSFGRSDFAKFLIANGAGVNAKTKTGNTPLSAAKEMRLPEVEALLRKSGAQE